jgi:CHAT domain-containing protein
LLFLHSARWEVPKLVEVPLNARELRYKYLANYGDEILNRRAYRAASRPLSHRWRTLGMSILAPVLHYLDDVSHLVVVPDKFFHFLPIHALFLNEAQETLLDRFAVSYIPAMGLIARLRSRVPVTASGSVVLAHTPTDLSTYEGSREQEIFLSEAQAVAEQVRVEALVGPDANSQRLQDDLVDQANRLVHLSCHGSFDYEDPLHSGVLLADGLFTARQWMQLQFQADLVTLSACEMALMGPLGGNELIGMSYALLSAGASSLLLGLWSVNALTTAALMVDFYHRLWDEDGNKRTDKARALREATLALRDGRLVPPVRGFDLSDPYYWAPFVLVGDWR